MEFLNQHKVKRTSSRRKFLTAASAVIGSLAFVKLWHRKKPRSASATFLTREGNLVEVPLENIPENKVRVTKSQLASWIWKGQKL